METKHGLDLKTLQVFSIKNIIETIKEQDSNPIRNGTRAKKLKKMHELYQEMYNSIKELVKQTMSSFFKPANSPGPSASAGPSTSHPFTTVGLSTPITISAIFKPSVAHPLLLTYPPLLALPPSHPCQFNYPYHL